MEKEKQNKLIILVGDSGSGKTELMKLVLESHKEKFSAIKKSSTRSARPGEENAIEIKPGCSIQEVDSMDYVYIGHNGNKYGFMREQIEGAFIQGKSPMVIVDNESLLIKLCREYMGRVCPIYIQRDVKSDEDFVSELNQGGKRTQEQIMQRVDSRYQKRGLWNRRPNLFGYRFIINGMFLAPDKLLEWFEVIAEENNIDIGNSNQRKKHSQLIRYFRSDWLGKPPLLSHDTSYGPIIDEDENENEIR